MDKKLYDLMDWPEIEAVVYSECKHPLDILGQHITPDGLLFQTFKPGAVGVKVVLTGKNKTYDMEQVDEAGIEIPFNQLSVTIKNTQGQQ